LTLVEILIVIVILAVLAAVVIPKFTAASARSKETARERNRELLQEAVLRFNADCGAYPNVLKDLAAAAAPAQGVDREGSARAINAPDWHGPYVREVPKDPISGDDYKISLTPPTVGKVLLPTEPEVTMIEGG
jgi:general secretion pathway protein G